MNNSNISFHERFRSEIALLLVTLLWGGTFAIVKESLNDISSMLFIALRFSFAALLLTPFVLKQRKYFNTKSVVAGIILGMLMFFAFAAQTVGLKYTTATKSGFLTGTLVVMVPILQTIIKKTVPSRGSIIGVALVFTGIVFLSSGGDSILTFIDDLGSNFNIGDWLTLVCAFLFALHVVYLDMFSNKYNFWVLLFFQIFISALMGFGASSLFSAVNLEAVRLNLTTYLLFGLVYTSILATLITTALQTKFQKNVTPTKAGIIYSFEPIFAAIIAFFALSEKITNFGLIGCVLIFSGLLISEVYDALKKRNGQ